MWSSAAVAHLLQRWLCCVFRDALVHASVVTSGYLSYHCLFYQLEPVWPFFSDLLVVHENPSRSAVPEILRPGWGGGWCPKTSQYLV